MPPGLVILTAVVLAALAGPARAAGAGGPPPDGAGSPAQDAAAPEDEGPEPDISFVEWDEGSDESPLPPNPFQTESGVVRRDAVPGHIELSDGRKVPGRVYTTRGKRLKIYNLERKRYEYVPVPALVRIEAVVEWERMERQWRFKEAGNPEKVYSGRKYPVRMLAWRLRLRNDHVIVGHILGQPLYATREGRTERWILHKRQKGEVGTSLEALVYPRRVVFGRAAYTEAVREMKSRRAGKDEAKTGPEGPEKADPGGD